MASVDNANESVMADDVPAWPQRLPSATSDAAPEPVPDVTDVPAANATQAHLQRAYKALDELYGRVSSFAGLDAVAQRTADAARDLRASADALRSRGHAALESVPRQPVVKAALDRLHRATEVLAAVKHAATNNATTLSESLAASVAAARERAALAVTDATTQVQGVLTKLTGRVLAAVDTRANAAAVRAGSLDARLRVQERAAAAAQSLKVSERAATATAYAAALDSRLGIRSRVAGALDRAQRLDTSVTGGRGQRLVEASSGLAAQGVEYLLSLYRTFEQAREHAAATAADSTEDTGMVEHDEAVFVATAAAAAAAAPTPVAVPAC